MLQMSRVIFKFFIIYENLSDLDCSHFNDKLMCYGKNYKLKIKVQIDNESLVLCVAFIAIENERCCI